MARSASLRAAYESLVANGIRRMTTKKALRERIAHEYATKGTGRTLSERELTAETQARQGKEWLTQGATLDYQWDREEVKMFALLDIADKLSEIVAQNREIIRVLGGSQQHR
jgi:hypothetical protein